MVFVSNTSNLALFTSNLPQDSQGQRVFIIGTNEVPHSTQTIVSEIITERICKYKEDIVKIGPETSSDEGKELKGSIEFVVEQLENTKQLLATEDMDGVKAYFSKWIKKYKNKIRQIGKWVEREKGGEILDENQKEWLKINQGVQILLEEMVKIKRNSVIAISFEAREAATSSSQMPGGQLADMVPVSATSAVASNLSFNNKWQKVLVIGTNEVPHSAQTIVSEILTARICKYKEDIDKIDLEISGDEGKELKTDQTEKKELKKNMEFVVRELENTKQQVVNNVEKLFFKRTRAYNKKLSRIVKLDEREKGGEILDESQKELLNSKQGVQTLLKEMEEIKKDSAQPISMIGAVEALMIESIETFSSSSQMASDELTDKSDSSELSEVSEVKEEIKKLICELNNLTIEAHLGRDDNFSHLLLDENHTSFDILSSLKKEIAEKISSVQQELEDRRAIEIGIKNWLETREKEDSHPKKQSSDDYFLVEPILNYVKVLAKKIMMWDKKGRMTIIHEGVPLKSALATYCKDKLLRKYYCYGCEKSYVLSRDMKRPCSDDSTHVIVSFADWNRAKCLKLYGRRYGISCRFIKFPHVTTDYVINCDGSIAHNCTLGVVVRDHDLKFKEGFTEVKKNKKWESTHIETEALRRSIVTAQNLCDVSDATVQIYSDCLDVVEAFNDQGNDIQRFDNTHRGSIDWCKKIVKLNPNIRVEHLHRELNQIADAFAKNLCSHTYCYEDFYRNNTVIWLFYEESILHIERVLVFCIEDKESTEYMKSKELCDKLRRGLAKLPEDTYSEETNQAMDDAMFEQWFRSWHDPLDFKDRDVEFPIFKGIAYE